MFKVRCCNAAPVFLSNRDGTVEPNNGGDLEHHHLPAVPLFHLDSLSGRQALEAPLFGPNGIDYRDVVQGKGSNCWLVSAIKAIAQHAPHVFTTMVQQNADQSVTVNLPADPEVKGTKSRPPPTACHRVTYDNIKDDSRLSSLDADLPWYVPLWTKRTVQCKTPAMFSRKRVDPMLQVAPRRYVCVDGRAQGQLRQWTASQPCYTFSDACAGKPNTYCTPQGLELLLGQKVDYIKLPKSIAKLKEHFQDAGDKITLVASKAKPDGFEKFENAEGEEVVLTNNHVFEVTSVTSKGYVTGQSKTTSNNSQCRAS